jgi:hypothetical protein
MRLIAQRSSQKGCNFLSVSSLQVSDSMIEAFRRESFALFDLSVNFIGESPMVILARMWPRTWVSESAEKGGLGLT